MKSIGILRKVDELGRIVLPKELRDFMEIGERAPLEIFTHGDNIILRKYIPGCHICGDVEAEVKIFKSKKVCENCLKDLKNY